MKKVILSIVAIVLAVALGVGCGYLVFERDIFHRKAETLPVHAAKAAFEPDITRLQEYMDNEAVRKTLLNSYGMTEAQADEFYETAAEWLTYNLIVQVTNESTETINLTGFEVKENGKNGIYLSTDFGSALGISAGGKGAATIGVLCRNGDLSDAAVKALVDQMTISVLYTKMPTEYADGSESVETTMSAALKDANPGY